MPLVVLLFLLFAEALAGSESGNETSTPSQHLIEEIRAANQARAAREREAAAWADERNRLTAIRAAVEAETARLQGDATAAEARFASLTNDLARLDANDEASRIRRNLAALTATIQQRLAALAGTLFPGAVTVPPAGGDLANALAALETTELEATTLHTEIVTGRLAGAERAVRLLRIAGAAAWWAGLDPQEPQGGTATMVGSELHLVSVADPRAIREALAEADGRAPPGIAWLPLTVPEAR